MSTHGRRIVAFSCLVLASCSADHSSSDPPGAVGTSNLNYVPEYPGAGMSGADEPLVGGMLCDYVPSRGERALRPETTCYFAPGQAVPAATIEQVLECAQETDAVHLRLTFDPAFVDNTFGANAIGWISRMKAPKMADKMPKAGMAGMPGMPGMAPPPAAMMPGPGGKAGHTWKDLVGSDHAELSAFDAGGEKIIQFKLDYISEASGSPSGYRTLGVTGGDGKLLFGDARDVVQYMTSIDRNLNERGYGDYIVDSPETDADYTPNAATPNWDYRVVYEAWIDIDAFGTAGFGDATIEFVHASPAKADSHTLIVKRGKCPCQKDGGCGDTPPPPCEPVGPDDFHCADGEVPPPPNRDVPFDCKDHPDDPNCQLW